MNTFEEWEKLAVACGCRPADDVDENDIDDDTQWGYQPIPECWYQEYFLGSGAPLRRASLRADQTANDTWYLSGDIDDYSSGSLDGVFDIKSRYKLEVYDENL